MWRTRPFRERGNVASKGGVVDLVDQDFEEGGGPVTGVRLKLRVDLDDEGGSDCRKQTSLKLYSAEIQYNLMRDSRKSGSCLDLLHTSSENLCHTPQQPCGMPRRIALHGHLDRRVLCPASLCKIGLVTFSSCAKGNPPVCLFTVIPSAILILGFFRDLTAIESEKWNHALTVGRIKHTGTMRPGQDLPIHWGYDASAICRVFNSLKDLGGVQHTAFVSCCSGESNSPHRCVLDCWLHLFGCVPRW